MADQWFFARDGRKYGPFSADRLKTIAARGQLRPEDTVWKQGIERGVLGAEVRGLFPSAAGKDQPVGATALAADGPSSQPPAPAVATAAPPASSEAEATPRGPTFADIGEELAPLQDLWEPPDSTAEEED